MEEEIYLHQSDNFIEAKLTGQQLGDLKEKLEAMGSIKRVYIATKELEYSENDLLVVAVSFKQKSGKEFGEGAQSYDVEKIEEVLSSLNMPYFILDLQRNGVFLKKLAAVKNSELIIR